MNKKWILFSSLLVSACGMVAIESDNNAWTEEDNATYTVLVSMHKANQLNDAQSVKMLQKQLNQENFISILYKRANILQKEVIDGSPVSINGFKNTSMEDIKKWLQTNYMSIVKPLLFEAAAVGVLFGFFTVDSKLNKQGSPWKNGWLYQFNSVIVLSSFITCIAYPCYKILPSIYKWGTYDWSRTRELKMISEMIVQLQKLQ